MKRILFGGIGALMLTITTPTLAQEAAAVDNNSTQITPFNLVFQGYQGYFVEQGIPSNGAFQQAVNLGQVDAEKLVESAIALGRLSSETLTDQSYLRKVQSSLELIDRRK